MNGKLTVIRMPDDSLLYFSTELTVPDQQYVAKAFWDQRWWRYVSFIKFWGPIAAPYGAVRNAGYWGPITPDMNQP